MIILPELKKAVDRLKRACEANEKVAICGDYDADGMTSTALIVDVLKKLKGLPLAIIPVSAYVVFFMTADSRII